MVWLHALAETDKQFLPVLSKAGAALQDFATAQKHRPSFIATKREHRFAFLVLPSQSLAAGPLSIPAQLPALPLLVL